MIIIFFVIKKRTKFFFKNIFEGIDQQIYQSAINEISYVFYFNVKADQRDTQAVF